MNIKDRQHDIYQLIKNNGSVRVGDLIQMFSVSAPTIRKDLTALEDAGLIKRSHGTARINQDYTTVQMAPFEARQKLNQDAKLMIAREAVKHINEGDSILLDAGTTTLEIARLLVGRQSLTIFTNSLSVATTFNVSRVTVNLIGGIYVSENFATHGPETEETLRKIQVNKAFISSTGIRASYGLVSSDPLDASTERAMIAAADKVYAVVDASKFERSNIYPFASFEDLDYLITDKQIEEYAIREALTRAGTEIIIAQ